MNDWNTLRTDIWTMNLPPGWSQGTPSGGGSLYFESSDGTKGIYVTTWNLGADDPRAAEDIVEAFQVADLDALKKMKDYEWRLLGKSAHDGGGYFMGITDQLADDKCYRTVGKIIAAPPFVVRAAFNDYACSDYHASQTYFAPIIASLQLYNPKT